MERVRICAQSVTGGRYTIALVRQLSDDAIKQLARDSRGRVRGIIPTDIVELVTYRESYGINGMKINQIEIGRIPA